MIGGRGGEEENPPTGFFGQRIHSKECKPSPSYFLPILLHSHFGSGQEMKWLINRFFSEGSAWVH